MIILKFLYLGHIHKQHRNSAQPWGEWGHSCCGTAHPCQNSWPVWWTWCFRKSLESFLQPHREKPALKADQVYVLREQSTQRWTTTLVAASCYILNHCSNVTYLCSLVLATTLSLLTTHRFFRTVPALVVHGLLSWMHAQATHLSYSHGFKNIDEGHLQSNLWNANLWLEEIQILFSVSVPA